MDEIRFNQPSQGGYIKDENNRERNSKSGFKKLLKILSVIVVLAIVIIMIFLGKDFFGGISVDSNNSGSKNNTNKIESGEYSAVFLSNGQVYFGKLMSKNDSELVLTDVYYLQLSGDETLSETKLNETKFSLIKLGNELHGPTDELFIITSQVLFYESLRDDSRVVQAIKNYQ